jgi:hypothetical protein
MEFEMKGLKISQMRFVNSIPRCAGLISPTIQFIQKSSSFYKDKGKYIEKEYELP